MQRSKVNGPMPDSPRGSRSHFKYSLMRIILTDADFAACVQAGVADFCPEAGIAGICTRIAAICPATFEIAAAEAAGIDRIPN